MIHAYAPGRVNLIGEHTDYCGGLVMPIAIDLGVHLVADVGGDAVRLRSAAEPEPSVIALDVDDPAAVEPSWGRYVAGVVAQLRPSDGIDGEITTTLPIGAGLSSSAALEVAVALALGFHGTDVELAQLCQTAEHLASGVPCGIMDQLASAAGVADHALIIDCATLDVTPAPIPDVAAFSIVDSGQRRTLAGSEYAVRHAQVSAAEAQIGPLRNASLADVDTIADPTIARRARHVVTENERVRAFASALAAGDVAVAGEVLDAGHASLRDDFEVSTDIIDALVADVRRLPGVHGVRLTGGGFGGAVVVLADPDASIDPGHGRRALRVKPSAGARLIDA